MQLEKDLINGASQIETEVVEEEVAKALEEVDDNTDVDDLLRDLTNVMYEAIGENSQQSSNTKRLNLDEDDRQLNIATTETTEDNNM